MSAAAPRLAAADEGAPVDAATPARRGRDPGIDAMRFVAALLVIIVHAVPGIGQPDRPWPSIVTIACRGAVPFFFVASGFFLPGRELERAAVTRPLLRLLPIHLFWLLAYFVALSIVPIRPWQGWVRTLATGGAAYHLWFLPVLGLSMAAVPVLRAVRGDRLAGLLLALAAAAGVARGAYHDVLGLPGEASRGGALAGPFLVFLGAWLARSRPRVPVAVASALTLGSVLLLLGEEAAIAHLAARPFTSHDFPLAVFPFGVAMLLLANSLPPAPLVGKLARLGRVSLAIYAVHLFFVWLLVGEIGNGRPWQVALVVAGSAAASTLIALLLARMPGLRRFAM